jgi:hypothetical protein
VHAGSRTGQAVLDQERKWERERGAEIEDTLSGCSEEPTWTPIFSFSLAYNHTHCLHTQYIYIYIYILLCAGPPSLAEEPNALHSGCPTRLASSQHCMAELGMGAVRRRCSWLQTRRQGRPRCEAGWGLGWLHVHGIHGMMSWELEGKERIRATEMMGTAKRWWAALGGGRLEWPAAAHPQDTRGTCGAECRTGKSG